MDINFTIRQVGDLRDLRLLKDFLHSHDLGYPGYHDWIDYTCIPEIEMSYKTAVIALHNGRVVGDFVWQPHKELPRTVEGKNMRIHPDVKERGLAYFLMKQCEAESRENFNMIIVDIPSGKQDVKLFFMRYGFRVLYQAHLYSDKRLETIMVRELRKVA